MASAPLLLSVILTSALTVSEANAQSKCDPKSFMDEFYSSSRNVDRLYYAHNISETDFKQKADSGTWDFKLPYIDVGASGDFKTFDQQRRAVEEATQWS